MKILVSGIMGAIFLLHAAGDVNAEKNRLPSAKPSGLVIPLPEPRIRGTVSVEEALKKRRSVRQFSGRALDIGELSQVLWAGQGISDPLSGFRTAPSAGELYPLETYVVTPKGVYHYLPGKHAVSIIRRGDFREELARAALGQMWIQYAAAVVVFTAISKRTLGRYPGRGNDYILMETGHAAQNILLQAVALGLVAIPVAAFYEQEMREILWISADQRILHLVVVGKNNSRHQQDAERMRKDRK